MIITIREFSGLPSSTDLKDGFPLPGGRLSFSSRVKRNVRLRLSTNHLLGAREVKNDGDGVTADAAPTHVTTGELVDAAV